MMYARRALVIGGSVSGRLAAHLLRDVGWDADVFERSNENLTGRGAGSNLTSHAIELAKAADAGGADAI